MEQIDVAVVGAGVAGLAIAAEIAEEGREVYVFEKNSAYGQETSSRNSEVIHGGLYYAKGSFKGRLCVEGKALIYGIDPEVVFHRRLGKLVVAVEESELPALEKIVRMANDNGVSDVRILDRKEIRELEPNITALAAVHSPSTGIVDAHQLMKYFVSRLKDASGGIEPIVFNSEVVVVERLGGSYRIAVRDSEGREDSVVAKVVVNSAGLHSDKVAEMAGIDADAAGYRLHFCKGEYFKVSSRHRNRIHHLVYPIPEEAGLGVHATLDKVGDIKLGPNVIYMRENDVEYDVDESHGPKFLQSAKRLLPFLELDDLTPDQTGIRAKLSGPGEPERDFVIQEESSRELPGLISLVGIESPGLTASPAIARYVGKMIDDLLKL